MSKRSRSCRSKLKRNVRPFNGTTRQQPRAKEPPKPLGRAPNKDTPFVLSDEQRVKHMRLVFKQCPWSMLSTLLSSWKHPLKRLILVITNRPGTEVDSTPFGNLSGAEFLYLQDHRTKTRADAQAMIKKYAVVLMDLDVRRVFSNMEDLSTYSSCLYGKFMGPTTYIMATKYTSKCLMSQTIRSLAAKTNANVVKETYIPNSGEQYWAFNEHSIEKKYTPGQLDRLSHIALNQECTRPSTYRDPYIPGSCGLPWNPLKCEEEYHCHVRHLQLNNIPDFFGLAFCFKSLDTVRVFVQERENICRHQTFVIPSTGAREVHVSFNTCHVPCVELLNPVESTDKFTLVNTKWTRDEPYGNVCWMGGWFDQAHLMVDNTYPLDTYSFTRFCQEIALVGINDSCLMLMLHNELPCLRRLLWKRLCPNRGSRPVWPMDQQQ